MKRYKLLPLLIGLLMSACVQGVRCSDVLADNTPARAGKAADAGALSSPEQAGTAAREISVSTFHTKQEAEALAGKIAASGYKTAVRREVTEEGETVYKVYIAVHEEGTKRELAPPVGTARESAAMPEEKPVGATKSFGDIFGGRRFYHVSLALSQLYTDNAFLSKVDKKSGSSTVLSPEIWILLAGAGEALGLPDISTMAPGGVIYGRSSFEGATQSGAYLLYHADIPLYSSLPSENTITHRAAAGYSYIGNQVSFGVSDQFTRSYGETLTGVEASPLTVDKYNGNLLDANASYNTGNRLSFAVDYSYFLTSYDSGQNSFRNLGDNSIAGYVFYKIRPKTALFVEYNFIDVSHGDDSTLDSREHNISAGMQWDITAKSKGSISAGYGIKDMAGQGGSFKNYIFAARIDHQLSAKNKVSFNAYRMTQETDYLQTLFLVATGGRITFDHRITTKISAAAGLGYERDDYEGPFSFEGVTGQRHDDQYDADLALRYEFRKWLKTDIGYAYKRMNSNFNEFEYSGNTFFFRIVAEL